MAQVRARSLLGMALGALVLLGTPGPVAAGGSRTRWVDDDGRAGSRGCDATRSTFGDVQSAIDASGPGDTIVVCPGRYRQDLTVSGDGKDALTIRAAVSGTAKLRASASGGGVPLLSVSDADGVHIRGIVLQAPTAVPCRQALALLWVSGSTDVQVDQVRFQPVGSDTMGDCGYETGLDVVGDAEVFADELVIRDFQKFGVLLQDRGSRVVVEDSSIRFLHAAEAPDAGGEDAVGLYALRGGGVTLRRNTIRSAKTGGFSTPLLGTGIHVYDTPDPLVSRNDVAYVSWAISVGVVIGTVRNNTVHHGRPSGPDETVGFSIGGGEFGSVFDNTARGYARGIVVDGGASGHAIHDNDFRGNSVLDCSDDTTGGGGTSGTSNFWTLNLGTTDDPDGICSPS
jgi:nitrous oxidase accessory protein NosD